MFGGLRKTFSGEEEFGERKLFLIKNLSVQKACFL
jgi:hypothetical protein